MSIDLPEGAGHLLAMRHIKIDDLLHLAAEATGALGILGSELDQVGATREAYAAAIEQHLALVDATEQWTQARDSLDKAAVLIRFCIELQQLDPRLRLVADDTRHRPAALHDRALGLLGENVHRYQMVKSTYLRAREHRLAGDPDAAQDLVTQPQKFFAGSGAETHRANFELERGFASIVSGNPDGYLRWLRERRRYWANNRWARNWATRGRFDQGDAVAHLSRGLPGDATLAVEKLRNALEHLARYPGWQLEGQLGRLSVLMTLAALEASRDGAAALEACRQALRELETVRSRWTVVVRSPSPLAIVIRVVLGELAGVLAELRDDDTLAVTRVGLHLSMVTKHSGVAELIRSQRDVLSPPVRRLLKSVVAAEDRRSAATDDAQREEVEAEIERVRAKLQSSVSRLLAGLVVPSTIVDADVQRVTELAGPRVVLDFVRLPMLTMVENGDDRTFRIDLRWFRTCLYGTDDADFGAVATGKGFDGLFRNGIYDSGRLCHRGVVDMFHSKKVITHEAWKLAAAELLPDRLTRALEQSPAGTSICEILICPHAELSRLPWAALVVGRERLVQRATLLHTPLLSSFAGGGRTAKGSALVRIVDDAELRPKERLDSAREQDAWNLRAGGDPAPRLAACAIPVSSAPPAVLTGRLADHLDDAPPGGWALVYVTSHGRGRGFDQQLLMPEGQLTAGASLGHPWPASVILNACHVAAMDDGEDAEPMGFVIAAMAGGAREVIGAVQVIGAPGAARIGASLVTGQDGATPLHELLNRAQRHLIDQGANLQLWASLAAFAR